MGCVNKRLTKHRSLDFDKHLGDFATSQKWK